MCCFGKITQGDELKWELVSLQKWRKKSSAKRILPWPLIWGIRWLERQLLCPSWPVEKTDARCYWTMISAEGAVCGFRALKQTLLKWGPEGGHHIEARVWKNLAGLDIILTRIWLWAEAEKKPIKVSEGILLPKISKPGLQKYPSDFKLASVGMYTSSCLGCGHGR